MSFISNSDYWSKRSSPNTSRNDINDCWLNINKDLALTGLKKLQRVISFGFKIINLYKRY